MDLREVGRDVLECAAQLQLQEQALLDGALQTTQATQQVETT
jgi:hypothetical protein